METPLRRFRYRVIDLATNLVHFGTVSAPDILAADVAALADVATRPAEAWPARPLVYMIQQVDGPKRDPLARSPHVVLGDEMPGGGAG